MCGARVSTNHTRPGLFRGAASVRGCVRRRVVAGRRAVAVGLGLAFGAGRGFEVVGALPFGEDGGVVAVLVVVDDVHAFQVFVQQPQLLPHGCVGVDARPDTFVL